MRQRPVRSGGSGRPDRMMWVVQSDEGGDGRTDEGGDGRMKMGTNPDIEGRVTSIVRKQSSSAEDLSQARVGERQ